MHIAYIISAYKNPEQLVRLIKRLVSVDTSFFIHVDKKTNLGIYNEIVEETRHLRNVFYLKRYRCDWGGFGHVQATIEGINEIIKRDLLFDYAILLTGQDYPIKTNQQIQEFFIGSNNQSYLDYFPLPNENWEGGGMDRIERWHIRLFNRHVVFPSKRNSVIGRKFPKGFRPFGGSSYWCLSSECIRYIHSLNIKYPAFTNFFKYVDVPDELYFQTILINSPLAGDIVNEDQRYIDWKDENAGSPAVLELSDFDRIAKSQKLFARKFDMDIDPYVLDRIDRELLDVHAE